MKTFSRLFVPVWMALLVGCASRSPINEGMISSPGFQESSNFASGPGFRAPGNATPTSEASEAPAEPGQETSRLFPVVNIDKKTPPPPPEPVEIMASNPGGSEFASPDPRLVGAGAETGFGGRDNPPSTGGNEATLQPVNGSTLPGYRLRPLDQIVINILEPVRNTTEDIIDEQGFITMQYIGRIQAAGNTTSELEKMIEDAYVNNQIYKRMVVNVIVPLRVYSMQGEVNRPGRYPIAGVITLLEAIADAGNFTEFANKKKIMIIRNGQQLDPIDYNDALNDDKKNMIIQPNDIIRVPRGW